MIGNGPGTAHGTPFGLAWLAAWAAICALGAGPVLGADSADPRFLEGLRQRRLFSLAEGYCQARLRDSTLDEETRATLVIEWSRSCAEHALYATPASADGLWQQAVAVGQQFEQSAPQSPWGVLVRAQLGLVYLSHGELARQQSELVADNHRYLTEAREQLRLATRQLAAVADEVAQRLRTTIHPGADPSGFSRDQWLALQRNLGLQLARAHHNQGQVFDAGTPDRANALNEALARLTPLTQLSADDPLSWQARVEELICLRLLGDLTGANRRLAALLSEAALPAEAALRVRAEQIRLALALPRIDAALAVVDLGRQIDGWEHPELDLAAVETFLAASAAQAESGSSEEQQRFTQLALERIALIQQRHGAYWQRRAEGLMAGRITGSSAPSGDLALMISSAESHYLAGRLDEALVGYERARVMALAQKDENRAFDLGLAAAGIEHGRKAHRAATERYRQLALAQPQHSRAAEAHQLAIFHAAQAAQQQSPPVFDEYVQLLEEHLQKWPRGATAHRAWWLLGKLRDHQQQPQQALAAYLQIGADYEALPEVLAAIDLAARRHLGQLPPVDPQVQPLRRLVMAYWESLFTTPPHGLPERWSPAQRIAALLASRWWLESQPPEYPRVVEVLSSAVRDPAGAPEGWTGSATSVLIFALAATNQPQQAAAHLAGLAQGAAADDLLAMLDELSRRTQAAAPQERPVWLGLQARALELLSARRAQLPAAAQQRVDRLEAELLWNSGRKDEALSRFAKLAEQNPRDGQIQESYAQLLSQSSQRQHWEQALLRWREVEQKSRPATARWFRAKYQLALVHERLGNKAQAAQIVKLTQVLHPDLGGEALKADFLALLARCQP